MKTPFPNFSGLVPDRVAFSDLWQPCEFIDLSRIPLQGLGTIILESGYNGIFHILFAFLFTLTSSRGQGEQKSKQYVKNPIIAWF